MSRLTRPDGVEIHWEQRGRGPVVVIVPHWSGVPSVFDRLAEELGRDHRVARYDARGTGESSRAGPNDMETAAVAGIAGFPFGWEPLRETEGMVASESVIDAFLEMLERDYRGALRTLLAAGNPQMTEEELRRRVRDQAEYCPGSTAIDRVRAWRDDDPSAEARALGDRLWLLYSPDVAGAWTPSLPDMRMLVSRLLPQARLEVIADGIVSRPDLTPALVRRITAGLESAS